MQSSLPLQIATYFNWWFVAGHVATTSALFIYKGTNLFYPGDALAWDCVILALFVLQDIIRLTFSNRGNKTENIDSMVKSLILSGVTVVGYVYFLRLQTWILQIEVIFNSIGLAMVSLEVVLSLSAVMRFYLEQSGY
jgi:transmembrane protein 216